MKYTKLSSMPYASAHVVRYDNGDLDLISYNTRVITVRNGWMECPWDEWVSICKKYSNTTIRHIGAFLNGELYKLCENKISYRMAKSCYENGEKMNIYTGEVIPV